MIASMATLFYNNGIDMETITLSSKFQFVIPNSIRKELNLSPGQKFTILRYGNRLELMPVRPIEEFRGILKGKGIDPDIEREDDRL